MLNRVVLIGRLTKDPELRHTQNGNATCSFTLACDRAMNNSQGEKETDFIPCDIPPYKSKLAEVCSNYLSKGKMVAVDGRIQVRSFDGQDGQKRWVTEVIAEDVRFLSPRDESTPPAQQTKNTPQPQPYQQPQQSGYPGGPGSYGQPPAPYPGQYSQAPQPPQTPPPGYPPNMQQPPQQQPSFWMGGHTPQQQATPAPYGYPASPADQAANPFNKNNPPF